MSSVPAELRRQVLQRAAGACEYCGLSQAGQEATFHVDHISPVRHGGQTVPENLALACVSCSLHKAARQSAPDPLSGQDVPLYHPRRDRWQDHFRWEGVRVVGVTDRGRATVALLKMNRPLIISIREEEARLGRHLPPQAPA